MADYKVLRFNGAGWEPVESPDRVTADIFEASVLVAPSGASFPGAPTAEEIFWRTDQKVLYRRDSTNTTWEAVGTTAASVSTDTTNFNGILSASDTTVQAALETIDNRIFTGSAAPATADGRLWYNNTAGWETLMAYDTSRSKWLSVAEFTIGLGHDSPDDVLLEGYGITVPGASTGILIPRNCCVKRISARCTGGNTTKPLNLYANGASVLSFSLSTSGSFGVYKNNSVNQDLSEDDYVWLRASDTGASPTDVVVVLWCSWRV